jgi:large subunit ribosomal protein L4
MASLEVLNASGKKAGTVDLPDEIFAAQVNVPVMHRVVRAQLAAARAGTHSTKTRSEVRGGGKKPWRQKGTGRARQGSIRAPQWTGGGVVFGPQPRDHRLRVNKKEKALALRSALSDRLAGGNLVVLDGLELAEPKTARAVELLDTLGLSGKQLLLVIDGLEDAAIKSFRNLRTVHLITFDQLNTYDVLRSDVVVFTRDSLDAFLGRTTPTGTEDELVLENGGGFEGLKAEAPTSATADPGQPSGRPPTDEEDETP